MRTRPEDSPPRTSRCRHTKISYLRVTNCLAYISYFNKRVRTADIVEVQVFGHLRVTSKRGDIELGGSKQQAVLLALVLANGAVVSSDQLIDLVWGDTPPAKPNVTLRSYISHLRRVLEPGRGPGDRAKVLITRAPGYAIDPRHVSVDIHDFAAAANTAFALPADTPAREILESTAAAFAHWPENGALPVDTASRAVSDFPHEVSRLTELHLAVSVLHYRAALDDGRRNETLASLEQATAFHPSSEELLALRMTALFQVGRSTDALAVFQRARTTLLDEFGLDPSPILTDLEQRILANDPSLLDTMRSPAGKPTAPANAKPTPAAPPGRSDALRRLVAALPGPGRLTPGGVIVGPAGIGKSTLLHAVADTAASQGTLAVWGRCADTASAATLRPWKSVLRDLYERTSVDDVHDIFGPQARDLCLVVPELANVFELGETSAPTGDDISDAITRTLRRWAEHQPLLICLEDLHWADPESLVVLHHLLDTIGPASESSTADQRVSVVATWRDTDVAAEATQSRVPRTRHLADIGRAVEPCRVQLEGLLEEDIDEVFRSLSDLEPDPEAIRRLAEHTGGNPLFVTELVRSGIDGGFEPTATIRDLVLRRLDPLPAAAHDVLCAAALCHPSIDESMLPDLTNLGDDVLSDCLEAAMAARLIEESPSQIGRYRFSHDLLAESLASELRHQSRIELHARIGVLLEKRSAPVAEIAHHYLLGAAAGTSLGAARFAHEAALEADELTDFAGAIHLIDQGLEALDLGPDAPVLRIEMLIDRAQILKFLSEHLESHRSSTRALDLAVDAGELDLAIVAAIVYIGLPRIDREKRNAEWLGYWSPPDESVSVLERCLELMPDDHRWRSTVILGLSNQMFAPHHDPERADNLARDGLNMLRGEHRPRAFCEGLVSMAHAHTRTFNHAERKAMLVEAVEIAKDINYAKIELRARKGLIGIALDDRDLNAAMAQVEAALIVAARSDDPFVSMQAESMQISLDLLVGDHKTASERVNLGFANYSNFGDAVMDTFGMQFFTLARASGQFEVVINSISDKLEGYDGPAYGAPLAAMLARAGNLDAALAAINRFTEIQMTWGGEGVLQFMTPSAFADAVADLSIERPEVLPLARPLFDALEPASSRMISLVGGADYPSIGCAYRGRLLTALGDTDGAAELLDEAIEHLSAINARPSLLWVRLAIAENLAASGHTTASQLIDDDLVAEADELGMSWAIAWARPRVQQRLNSSA